MASKKLVLTCYLAFIGFALAEIMPKEFVSKMQIVENEAKALMHMEPKRGSDDFVSTIKTYNYFIRDIYPFFLSRLILALVD